LDSEGLKKAGLKITGPRIHILKLLQSTPDRHLSAEDIYKRLQDQGQDLSLATVYRVLAQLETAGMVLKHHFEGGHSVFELADQEHHDHLVCIQCAKIVEFVDDVIEKRQHAIADQQNFQMTNHYLTIFGLCQDCQ